ncbi:MAG: DUF3341 domain-containing protein [Bacteriovorax sp.]|nr:DUF3341 domain-containing protein [Bacteriovorax sp.]
MKTPIYGLMAEFKEPEEVLRAVKKVYSAGFRKIDAFSPFPIDGLAEELGQTCEVIGWIALSCGLLGLLTGIILQYYSSAIAYPMNIGGRPLNSWPSFVPVCFELMVLFAATGSVLSMFLLNRLPKPYHPVFNSPEFNFVTRDRFFLLIEKNDPLFDLQNTRIFLESLNAEQVIEVSE